jgi:hypothetical protein
MIFGAFDDLRSKVLLRPVFARVLEPVELLSDRPIAVGIAHLCQLNRFDSINASM